MLPGLDFEPLAAGEVDRKGNELFGSYQVLEGFSEKYFGDFQLWLPHPARLSALQGLQRAGKRCVDSYWCSSHCIINRSILRLDLFRLIFLHQSGRGTVVPDYRRSGSSIPIIVPPVPRPVAQVCSPAVVGCRYGGRLLLFGTN
jgi:hypothetical protein